MLTKGRRNRSSSHPVASLARHRHLALETTTSLVALMVALGAIGAMPEGRNVEAAHRPFPWSKWFGDADIKRLAVPDLFASLGNARNNTTGW